MLTNTSTYIMLTMHQYVHKVHPFYIKKTFPFNTTKITKEI